MYISQDLTAKGIYDLPHQDHINMQGTANAYTVWTTLLSCGIDNGLIAVQAGSHLAGPLQAFRVLGAGVLTCERPDHMARSQEFPASSTFKYVSADMDLGDVRFSIA